MKRELESEHAPEASAPKFAKAEMTACKAVPKHCDENLDSSNAAAAPVPSAREIAAARAARVRLGLEEPAEGDAPAPDAAEPEGKLPTGAEPEKVDIEHVPSHELPPLDAAQAVVKTLGAKVSGKDWVASCEALHQARQLAVHHKEILKAELPTLGPLLLQAVKNLRSAMQKSALMCVCDLVDAFADDMLPLLKGSPPTSPNAPMMLILLKASQDKRFVADEAQRALAVVGAKCTPLPTQTILLPYASHKSPKVRAEAAQALNASLAHQHKSSGASTLTEPAQLSTMLQLAGKLISDAQPKARAAAQEMCEQLRSAVCEGKNEEEAAAAWEGACKKELSSTAAAKVLKLCK